MTNLFKRSRPLSGLRFWVPSIYMTMAFPNVVMASVAAIMCRNLGMTTEQVAICTGQLYLPWVLKPIWAPLLESFGTKRRWLLTMQLVLAVSFALASLSFAIAHITALTLVIFWIVGFALATQDIAIDGIFMAVTKPSEQARYAGMQNLCWNFGAVVASGFLVSLTGLLKSRYALDWSASWAIALMIGSMFLGILAIWHRYTVPLEQVDVRSVEYRPNAFKSFHLAWQTFITKPKIWSMLLVVFMYRLGEGFLEKIGPLFLMDSRGSGGLGLDNQTLGLINGSLGTVAFIAGAIIAGFINPTATTSAMSRSLPFVGSRPRGQPHRQWHFSFRSWGIFASTDADRQIMLSATSKSCSCIYYGCTSDL